MAYIEQTFVDGVTVVTAAWLNGLKEVLGAAGLFQIYDPTQTYSVGDFVSYQGKLYKCTTEISAPEQWNSAHWESATIEEYSTLNKVFWATYGTTTYSQIGEAIEQDMIPVLKYGTGNQRVAQYKGTETVTVNTATTTFFVFEDFTNGDTFVRLRLSSTGVWSTQSIDVDVDAITNAQIDSLFS